MIAQRSRNMEAGEAAGPGRKRQPFSIERDFGEAQAPPRDGWRGAAGPQERESLASRPRAVAAGTADHEGGAGPNDPRGRPGVLAPIRDEGELLGDGANAAQTRAHSKKKSLKATEQSEPRIQELRRRFVEFAKKLDPRRLVFIDEAGSHIAMTRDYARAPRGERAVASVPRNAGTVTTMIGALDAMGVRAMMTIEGATDGEVFETFLTRVLVPKLRPGDIVILDNVGAHKTPNVRPLIEAAGASLLYLPPYSPDLNPIELCWSKMG